MGDAQTLGTIRAEVSGWDRAGGYFVERTDVQVDGGRMVVCLHRPMPLHSVLCVRLLLVDGSWEAESRVMQVTRCRRNPPSGYHVRCRRARARPRAVKSGQTLPN